LDIEVNDDQDGVYPLIAEDDTTDGAAPVQEE
jgi:hypothetical protein